MVETVAIIGFGEAAQAFAPGMNAAIAAYDRKLLLPDARDAKRQEGARAGVRMTECNTQAVAGAKILLSLVTADQALAAATETAAAIDAGALYCDMNSVAPDTKRAAAAAIEAVGGRYVDVAVMAPVHPARLSAPLLTSGPHAEDGTAALRRLGFTAVGTAGDAVGRASAIKMIRSIMVKGIEALSAECLLAADLAGVRDEVIGSLDASWPGADWARRGDYHLDRMLVHGLRRAEEMAEVVKTVEALGLRAAMSRGTVERQREIGALRLPAPDGLDHKIALLRPLLSRHHEERPS